jgi:hypothetical protein
LLEVEHVPIRVRKLAEPLTPLHLLGRQRELDALLSEPLVVREDVVREERDPRRSRLRRLHLAHMDPGLRTPRAHLDPVARVLGCPLDGRIRIRDTRSDVRHIEAEDVPVPSDGLEPIRDDDRDRVDPEDSHGLPGTHRNSAL